VSRLVACITASNQQSGLKGSDIGGDPFGQHSDGSTEEDHKLANCTSLVVLLQRLTVEATLLLFPYIKVRVSMLPCASEWGLCTE
jgi:hypothetical protein